MRILRAYGRALVCFALPVTGIMIAVRALLDALDGDTSDLLEYAVLLTVAYTAVLGTVEYRGTRAIPLGVSTSPRQQREVPVVVGPELPHRIVDALRSLPATVTVVDVPAGRYVGERGTGWTGWGEDVVVQLTGSPAQAVAVVSSRPSMRWSWRLDFGRGWKAVEHVARALSAEPAARLPVADPAGD